MSPAEKLMSERATVRWEKGFSLFSFSQPLTLLLYVAVSLTIFRSINFIINICLKFLRHTYISFVLSFIHDFLTLLRREVP